MPFALKSDRCSVTTATPGCTDSRDGNSPAGMLRGWSRARKIPAALLVMALALFSGCGTSHPELTLDGGPPGSESEGFAGKEPNQTEERATGAACGESDRDALRLAKKKAHYNLRGIVGKAGYRVRYSLPRDLAERGTFCVEVEAEAVRP